MPAPHKTNATSIVWLPQLDGAPPRATRIHGRAATVAALAGELALRRLVTITGTGGIGKTTVALAVAEHMHKQWRQGVVYVDLAPLAGGGGLAPALAAALVMERPGQRTLDDITKALRNHHMLLVLDSCERLLDDVADMADALLDGVPGLRLLTTSREPLGLSGEWVTQLPPLAVPPDDVLTMEQALHWPAARLFADRMERVPTDDEASGIAGICRRLDGIPLALELAAANVGLLGVRALARRLGDGLHWHGGRGGQGGHSGRHRTMEAALDWSYALLGEQERQLLRRLSLLRCGFSLEEALHLGADNLAAWEDALDAFAGLLRKSMLATISDTDAHRYRLLETTRHYAAARLAEGSDYRQVLARFEAM